MIAVVSMPALNQIDIIPGPVWLPQVEKPQERSPPFSDIREAIPAGDMDQRSVCTRSLQSKTAPAAAPAGLHAFGRHCCLWGAEEFYFFHSAGMAYHLHSAVAAVPALLDKRACRWRTQYHKD